MPAESNKKKSLKSIVLVDDHPSIRDGWKYALQKNDNIRIVGEAGSRVEAIRLAKEYRPDFIVMDISLPDGNGIEIAGEILKMLPKTNIIMFSMFSDVNFVKKAFKTGAKGYLVKETATENLLEAIETISAGSEYFDRSLTGKIMGALTGKSKPKLERPLISILYEKLTAKEQEIFNYIALGMTNREISTSLNVAYPTVRNHVAKIMDKMQTNSRAMLVRYAVELGIMDF